MISPWTTDYIGATWETSDSTWTLKVRSVI